MVVDMQLAQAKRAIQNLQNCADQYETQSEKDLARTGLDYARAAIRHVETDGKQGIPMCDYRALVKDWTAEDALLPSFARTGYDTLMRFPLFSEQAAPTRNNTISRHSLPELAGFGAGPTD